MAIKYVAPTANFVQTTLNGAITDSVQTITLSSTTNLQAPGYVVIDRTDSDGTSTPSAREVVSYTGISSNDLTGCTRGEDNSTGRSHSDGAVVETMPTVGMWNSLTTIVDTAFTNDGYLKAINSPVSISFAHLTNMFVSDATITNSLNVSGASVTGLGLSPVWVFLGNFSGPTTLVQAPVPMPRAGTWDYFNVLTRTVASTSSVAIDVNKNGSSIFEAGTRPAFLPGGTFASTASINTKTFNKGDMISVDIDLPAAGENGHVTDITVMGRAV